MKSKIVLSLCLFFFITSAIARNQLLMDTVETYDLDTNAAISLENINGDIKVTSWNSSEVELTYRIYGRSKKALDRVEVIIDEESDRLRVETKHHDSNGWGGNDDNATVEFELRVPAGIELDSIETVNGDIEISGVQGEVSASTVNGDVEVEGLTLDSSVSTVNGDIEARFDHYDGIRSDLESVNGSIDVYLPASANTSISAETVHGDIDNDFNLKADKGFVGVDLNAKIGSGNGRLKLDTVNGSIEIHERSRR